jgi:hypothetical protein
VSAGCDLHPGGDLSGPVHHPLQRQQRRHSTTRQDTHIDKKEKQIFLIYKEIQMGSGAKSYMRKGFLIYEEMRKYFFIYEEAVSHI